MPVVVIYSSTQACPPALDLAFRLRAQGHQVRSLSELPTPRPARLYSLQLELAGLQQDERTIRWVLSQYTEGIRMPDADRERDLRSDLEVTLWQIDNVTAFLAQLKGGVVSE